MDKIDDREGEDSELFRRSRLERNRLFSKYFVNCDDYTVWADQEPGYTEEDMVERVVYATVETGSPEHHDVAALEKAAGVTLDPEDLTVRSVQQGPAHDMGVTEGMVVSRVCGGRVHDGADVAEILSRIQTTSMHVPVLFQELHTATLQHEQICHERRNPPYVAALMSLHNVDISIGGLLGFRVSGGLKVYAVREKGKEDGDITPAAAAQIRKGMVVRRMCLPHQGGRWAAVRSVHDWRRFVVDAYEFTRQQSGIDDRDRRTIPAMRLQVTFTKELDTPGERTAQEFHALVGEQEWQGCSTVHIDAYERLQGCCGCLSTMCTEGEDTKMMDFKRYVTAYFVRNWVWRTESTQDLDDMLSTSKGVGSEATKSAHNLQRILTMGSTTRHGLCKGLRTNTQGGSGGALDESQKVANVNQGLADMDAYGDIVLKLLKARIAEEVEETSKARVGIFYSAIAQFVLALGVFSVGAEDIPSNGGKFAPFVATTAASCVGIVSSVLGFVGAIGGGAHIEPQDELKTGDDMPELGEPNQSLMQQFLACNCWLLAILTAFLFSEIIELDEQSRECGGTNLGSSPGATTGCSNGIVRHTVLVALCGAMLVAVFLGVMFCTNLLDSVNDKSKLDSKELFMTYFRVRLFEAKLFLHKHLLPYVRRNYYDQLDNDRVGEAGKIEEMVKGMQSGLQSGVASQRRQSSVRIVQTSRLQYIVDDADSPSSPSRM